LRERQLVFGFPLETCGNDSWFLDSRLKPAGMTACFWILAFAPKLKGAGWERQLVFGFPYIPFIGYYTEITSTAKPSKKKAGAAEYTAPVIKSTSIGSSM